VCVEGVLKLRFDFDSTRQSGHHDSMNHHTRRHFTLEVSERAIPTSTIEGCYPTLIRDCECHSYYHVITSLYAQPAAFFIGYKACRRNESKSNRNFDNYVAVESKLNQSRITIVIATLVVIQWSPSKRLKRSNEHIAYHEMNPITMI